MATYAQISLQVFERKRRDGSVRRYEFRLLEADSAGDTLPFDLSSDPVLITGSNSHDLTATIKPTQISFQIKTISSIAEKLRTAEDRQYRLTIRELEANEIVFEGYIKPDFPKYDIFKQAETVQVTATGELGTLFQANADGELRSLQNIFTRINDETGFPSRVTDFYMRTRYDGQSLSDPVPSLLWMTETGKIGDEGTREAAIRQIAQEFNFQIFQRNGRLVVADVYERLRNPESVNRYLAGNNHDSDNLLIELDETNIDRVVNGREVSATGQRRERIGRVVQQRQFLEREESVFPAISSPELVGTINEYSLPGRVTGGDIIRINELRGTVSITDEYIPPQSSVFRLNVRLQIVQFVFVSEIDETVFYYNFSTRSWETEEIWLENFVPIQGNLVSGETVYSPATWRLPENTELAEIPEEHRGEITLRVRRNVLQSNPIEVTTADVEMTIDRLSVELTFNDRPEDLYYQSIAENGSGKSIAYPIFEADFDSYNGDKQAMRIGEQPNLDIAASAWVNEEDSSLISFTDLAARKKAWLLLGTADRIHLVVGDITPISLLNVLRFKGRDYLPVCVQHNLFTGSQEIWMLPGGGLEYDFTSRYTYNPEEITSGGATGTSRGWVTNRIIDSMNSNLAAGAIARTTGDLQGLVEAVPIDRENLLFEGDTIDIINPFNLDRVTFTVIADQEGAIITTDPETVLSMMPSGSYVYSSIDGLAAGVRQSRYATEIYSKLFGVGVLREDVDGVRSSLPVHLFVKIRGGTTLNMTNEQTGIVYTLPIGGDKETWYEGSVDLPIQSQLISAPEDSRIQLGNSFISAILQVDPGGVYANVTRRLTGDAIGTLSADRSGVITSLPLQDIDADIELQDGQELRLINRSGRNEKVIVAGDQTVTAPSDTITIQSVELQHEYVAGHAYVKEPSYSMTGKLTIQAGYTELLQTATSDQATAIAGLELDVTDLESASATLVANVNNLEDDLDTETDARLQLQADLDSAQSSLTTTISRVSDNEDDIEDLEIAQAGLIQLVGDIETDVDGLDDNLGDLETVIGRIDARQVMYVQSDGEIAYVDMATGSTGSNISISADYVSINDIIFDDDAGTIRSANYGASDGWILRRNGDAEFNNVFVRGTILEMNLSGSISLPGGIGALSSSGLLLSTSQAVSFGPPSTAQGGMSWDAGVLIDSWSRLRLESGVDDIELVPGPGAQIAAKGRMVMEDTIQLHSRSSPPPFLNGMLYFDTSKNRPVVRVNGEWRQIQTSSY